ncbi:hypothetical protein [Flavobacterium akiainvivens]|nr:hypothetical protein [Flavobacterium akiainvivens]
MKRHFMFLTACILTLVFTSCSDDDDNGNAGGPVPTTFLTVTVDGVEKSFSNVQGRWVDGGNFLEINATNDGIEWVSFTVMSETTRVPAGNYTLDDGSAFTILALYTAGSGASQNYAATRGTLAPEDAFALQINQISNTNAEGTFSGVLASVEGETTLGTVTLTNGAFSTSIGPN